MLSRLGVTYGVLRRLGFSEERVEECLRAISGVELEEAFDWVRDTTAILYSPHLPSYSFILIVPKKNLVKAQVRTRVTARDSRLIVLTDSGEVGDPVTPRSSKTLLPTPTAVSTPSHTPQTPRTPVQRQRSLSPLPTITPPSRAPSRLDANAPVFTPSFARGPSQLREEVQAKKSDVPEPVTVTADVGGTYTGDDPDAEYVRLRLKMDALPKGNGDPTSVAQLRLLQARLDDVKKSYFFREKFSEAQYRLEREKLNSEALQAKLRGLSDLTIVPPTPPEIVSSPKHQPPDLKHTEPPKTNTDLFDDDSGDESTGGLFEILQEVPATETTADGITVRLQSMEVPKNWSGRTPKVLLQEMITKKDKYAVVNYACASGSSRVRRASLKISWDGGRTQHWSMDDVGCPDLKQAEQYISTVALHTLTFPALEGFALGGTSGASTQTFFRLFPPVFRSLWDELEAKRKETDDAINRAAWAKLKTIVQTKLESQSKVSRISNFIVWFVLRVVQSSGKSSKAAGGGKGERQTRGISSFHELSEEQIKAGFEARRASPAYQQMLVSRRHFFCPHSW